MQSMRFQSHNIFITQKTIEFVGQIIARSKKKVTWVIQEGQEMHTVVCIISFYSGKKKVSHNGYVIMNIVDSKECLDCVVFMGNQRMIFMVDEKTELASVERKFHVAHDQFLNFNNMYSQPITKTYQAYFSSY